MRHIGKEGDYGGGLERRGSARMWGDESPSWWKIALGKGMELE